MSGNHGLHPTHDELTAYGLGKLHPPESVAIETHIAECEECCETLHDLGNDTFVDLVRESNGLQFDSVDDAGTIGLDEAGNGTVFDLPSELTNHPRYRVLELLGKGGMGNVYKAEHTLMNRSVALKVINRELVQNAQAVERFRREVQSAAQLAHPNIVTAYDAEQVGDMHLLVMEYVQGDNLADLLKREGPLDITVACDYVCQAAQGLQHAHEHGMVHRDIKPHNLMVTAKDQVKILDFGLATLANASIAGDPDDTVASQAPTSNLTSAGSIMGTPDFISPEQATDASAADIRSDIYSVGCTFFYLLTGRPPFSKGTALQRIKAHTEQEVDSIEHVREDVPPELAEILRRMMAKEPSERFQTPAEVADALSPFVDVHRSTPPPNGVTNRSAASDKRSWWPPTVVQSLICVAFAFILAGMIYVATDNGTLVVDSDDDHVEIIIRAAGGLRIVDTLTGTTAKRLRRGEYAVELKGDDNDFELSQDRFVLKRGDKVIVRVTRKQRIDDAVDEPNKPLVVRQVWHDAADVSGAASPDGRYLSFTDDTGDLAVRDLALKTNRRLTDNGARAAADGYAESSKFSPDGKQLVYAWLNKDEMYELRIIDRSGGDPSIVYSSDDITYMEPMDWSPNGEQILAVLTSKDNTSQIALISVAEKAATNLKSLGWQHPTSMAFSPDGRYIAYDLPQGDDTLVRDIHVIAADGTGETTLIAHPANDAFLGWSPDGNWILFSSNRSGTRDAWLVGVSDGKRQGTPLLAKPNLGDVVPMGFTSEGSYYFGVEKRVSEVCTASLDSETGAIGPLKNVAQRAIGRNYAPAWSANGDLAYLSKHRHHTNVVILTSSGQERVLSPRLRYILPKPPAWSPNGSSLLVSGEDLRNQFGLFLVDVSSGSVEQIVRGLAVGEWSPDGNAVYVHHAEEQRIYRRDLHTHEERDIVQSVTGGGVFFIVSPDGESIAFKAKDDQQQAWVLRVKPIAGGEAADVYVVPNEKTLRWLQWTFDGKSLVLGESLEDQLAFSIIPAQGGVPRELQLDVEGVEYLKVHPDGKQVALSIKQEGTSEVSVLENFLPPLEDNQVVNVPSKPEPKTTAPKVRQVMETGNTFAVPSPDGRSLAVTDWQGNGDVALRDLLSGKIQRLTGHDRESREFAYVKAWSSDGRRIATSWFRPKGGLYDLRLVGLDGSEPKTIAKANGHYLAPFSWSAITQQILVARTGGDATSHLALISADDGTVRVLTSLGWNWPMKASLSPDGRYVVYDVPQEDDSPERDIMIIATDGNSGGTLVGHPSDDHSPLWTADSKRVVFVSDRNGSANPWVLRVENGQAIGVAQQVAIDMNRMSPLGISYDGTYFYSSSTEESDNIYVAWIDAKTGKVDEPVKLPLRYEGRNSRSAWSPDGKQLAYISGRSPSGYSLILRSTETGRERVLVSHVSDFIGHQTRPVWSGDGSTVFLAEIKDEKRRRQSIVIDVSSGEVSPLKISRPTSAFPYDGLTAVLARDGKTYFYISNEQEGTTYTTSIVTVKLDTTEHKHLAKYSGKVSGNFSPAPNEAYRSSLAISPNGRQLVFASDTSLFVVKVTGGEAREIARAPEGEGILQVVGIEWTPDGRSLIYGTAPMRDHRRKKQKNTRLWQVPVEGGKPRELGLTVDGLSHLAVHPSGKQITYTAPASNDSSKVRGIWAADNFLPLLEEAK